jgi:hypothetical protein
VIKPHLQLTQVFVLDNLRMNTTNAGTTSIDWSWWSQLAATGLIFFATVLYLSANGLSAWLTPKVRSWQPPTVSCSRPRPVSCACLFLSDLRSPPQVRIVPPVILSDRDAKKLRKLILPQSCVERISASESKSSGDSLLRKFFRNKKVRRSQMQWRFKMNDEMEGRTPLCVFINPKSGGQQGHELLSHLKTLLHRVQVSDSLCAPSGTNRRENRVTHGGRRDCCTDRVQVFDLSEEGAAGPVAGILQVGPETQDTLTERRSSTVHANRGRRPAVPQRPPLPHSSLRRRRHRGLGADVSGRAPTGLRRGRLHVP